MLILKLGTNWYLNNLHTINEITIIIIDKYE